MIGTEDLETVLAVARHGSLSGAARALGVNHSTVSRRLAALEAATGHTLFRRLSRGYVPTGAGEQIVAAARRLEEELQGLARTLSGKDIRLAGTVRLTAPDDLANHLLAGPLARFRAAYPGIATALAIENRMLNLGRREAEVALRVTNKPPPNLVGRRVCAMGAALYGARSLLPADLGAAPARALPEALPEAVLKDLPWIGWEEDGESNMLKAWQQERAPRDRVAYRANSVANQFAAARAGLGLAALPCHLGDSAPELIRLLPPQPAMSGGLWILTHPDLRRAARVAALTDFLFTELRRHAAVLSGGLAAED